MSAIGPYFDKDKVNFTRTDPYVVVPNILTQKECKGILKYVYKTERVSEPRLGAGKIERGVRDTEIYYFKHTKLKNKIENIIVNNNPWNIKVDSCEFFQLGVYKKLGHYSWHVDTTDLYSYSRKLSFSIILNDPSEWKGGKFQMFSALDRKGNPIIKTVNNLNRTGTMLLFPSETYHRVTPVTEGQRISLVGWAWGP